MEAPMLLTISDIGDADEALGAPMQMGVFTLYT
jgi:hypothetical protein